MDLNHRRPTISAALALIGAILTASCGDKPKEKPVPTVGYVIVQPTSVAVSTELPGRINALATAEVRPQVNGVIQKRMFAEGSYVGKGQPLYQIDPSLYRAATAEAVANLASARAQADAARTKAARYAPLARAEAVSKQEYSDAAAAARQGQAAVAQQQAQLNTARINLKFTTVPAPISGRIGRSLVTAGSLVTSGQATPLAVISVLDPVYVDLQQSAAAMLALRRRLSGGGASPASSPVRLVLDDGSDYGMNGTVEFSEATADPSTGTVTLRARFPNPQNLLMPGMFVRARFVTAAQSNVFLVPQVALTRDPQGNAQVFVLDKGGRAVSRTVTADHVDGDNWVVTAGLKSGDKLITQGIGQFRPGDKVKSVPAGTPQKPGSGGGGKRRG